MENPFVYGEAVMGKDFCDREEEIENLKREILSGQKVFLISSRKFGKTSLIKTALHQLKKEIITVFLDLESFASYKEFLDAYLLALTRENTPAEKILTFIRQITPGLRINLEMDELGRPLLSLGYDPTSSELNKVASKIFALPEIIAKKRKKKMIVVFDEFQEILKFNGKSVEGTLRACIQHQRQIAYVFAGSQRRLLMDMVASRDRPFYKIGPVLSLKKIPESIFLKFIKSKFRESKIKIADKTIHEIISLSENIPYYNQMFCHELWDSAARKQNRVGEKDLPTILEQLLKENSQNFHIDWSRINISRRQLLKAIAHFGGKSIFSQSFLKKSNLGLPSSVQRTLLSLLDEGYLDREGNEHFFNDILFREWIKKL